MVASLGGVYEVSGEVAFILMLAASVTTQK
jgi:hypothetical protein